MTRHRSSFEIPSIILILVLLFGSLAVAAPVAAQKSGPDHTEMSVTRMNALIEAIGDDVDRYAHSQWRFEIESVTVVVIADETHDRMRVLVGIAKVDAMPRELYERLMQANFDTALDARYAVAKGVLWSMFLHPLKSLSAPQFLSGVGQTVNLFRTFGNTFSSGGLSFQGGDSTGLIERQLIEKLLEQGKAI